MCVLQVIKSRTNLIFRFSIIFEFNFFFFFLVVLRVGIETGWELKPLYSCGKEIRCMRVSCLRCCLKAFEIGGHKLMLKEGD